MNAIVDVVKTRNERISLKRIVIIDVIWVIHLFLFVNVFHFELRILVES